MRFGAETPDATARAFLASGAFWGTVGSAAGLLGALELVAPDWAGGVPWLGFGRLRPAHVNLVLFGFVFSLLLAGIAHVVPRLCRVERLWSERLGQASAVLWNGVFVAAALTLPLGRTQGRDLAELAWPIDGLFVVALALFTVSVFGTMVRRREPRLYVSLWYVAGALPAALAVYFAGNVMWRPATGSLAGIVDAVWAGFYRQDLIGLVLTPAALALAYWVIPRAVRAPVWSGALALIGFWSLAVLVPLTGAASLADAPIPRWLAVLSVIASVALVVPATAVLLNLWLPMRGRWGRLHDNVGARFVFAGLAWYALATVLGAVQALPQVQDAVRGTHGATALAHLTTLGFAGFVALGTAYTILPAVTGRPLWSRRLADLSFWLMVVGLTLMALALAAAGLVQGRPWPDGGAGGRVLARTAVPLLFRAVSGVALVCGLGMLGVNVALTLWARPRPAGLMPAPGTGPGPEATA